MGEEKVDVINYVRWRKDGGKFFINIIGMWLVEGMGVFFFIVN